MPAPKPVQDSDCYLFVATNGVDEPSCEKVFYQACDAELAESLCRLCQREYGDELRFSHRPSSSFSPDEQVLMDEVLDDLSIYDDPDPGIYDPPPTRDMLMRAQYARRAQRWEEMLKQRRERGSSPGRPAPDSQPASGPHSTDRGLADDVLLQICRIAPDDPELTAQHIDDLRRACSLIGPRHVATGARLELALSLLGSVLGSFSRFNPTHLPFGYSGPTIKSDGWLDRDTLEQTAKQIVGLMWADCSPDRVAFQVERATSEAIRLGFMEEKQYDAWRPGMPSGSGWRAAISATAYGLTKARSTAGLRWSSQCESEDQHGAEEKRDSQETPSSDPVGGETAIGDVSGVQEVLRDDTPRADSSRSEAISVGWAPEARARHEASLKAWRLDRKQAFQRSMQARMELERELHDALQAGDVLHVLAVLGRSVAGWATELKENLFELLDDDEDGSFRRRISCGHPAMRPLFLLIPFIGSKEAFDLLELAHGHEKAAAFQKRLDSLEDDRTKFGDAVAGLARTWDAERDYEAFDAVDEHRSWLKQRAFEFVQYIENLTGLLQSGTPAVRVATPSPGSSYVKQLAQDDVSSYEWARQAELVRATNQVLGEGTLDKGVLSRACKNARVETNGKPGQASRVRVTSFLTWVSRQFQIGKDEQDQVRNAIIGEITARNS
jgi:hypothetical protein